MAKNLIVFEPAPQEVSDLRSLLNRLVVLEKNLRRELNRQEKAGKSLTFHRLEQQSITRSIKRQETEIVSFKIPARDCVNASTWLQRGVELLSTVPGIVERTAWLVMVVLGGRQFQCPAEVVSFLGLNPIEKRSGKSEYGKPRLSKSGSSHYRQALYFPTMVASRKNRDVQALYGRLVNAGKPKMYALGAAMRKLVHICYDVYKNQQPYQPQVSSPKAFFPEPPDTRLVALVILGANMGSAKRSSHLGSNGRGSALLSIDSRMAQMLVAKEDGIYT
jgi:transposase